MDGPVSRDERPLLLQGDKVGLALMRREDIPAIARWNQDLEFTASIGTPGEAQTLEMRQESFDKVEVNGYNQRAIRLYERLGFRHVGGLREALLLNGNRYDQVIMDLLRTEFELEHVSRFQGLAHASSTP